MEATGSFAGFAGCTPYAMHASTDRLGHLLLHSLGKIHPSVKKKSPSKPKKISKAGENSLPPKSLCSKNWFGCYKRREANWWGRMCFGWGIAIFNPPPHGNRHGQDRACFHLYCCFFPLVQFSIHVTKKTQTNIIFFHIWPMLPILRFRLNRFSPLFEQHRSIVYHSWLPIICWITIEAF